MPKSKVTIRDVAREAGVSIGTASRAINDAPGVQGRTRDLVLAAARALDYQPNAAARALRSRSSRLIGCLFADVENPLFARLYNALQDRWAEEGFVTMLSTTSGRLDREIRSLEIFVERGLDAIVIAPNHERDPGLLHVLKNFPAPVFILDRDMAVPGDRLLFDHQGAMRAAVQYLAALGHRDILPVLSHGDSRPGQLRHAGFDMAMREAGLPVFGKIEPETQNSLVFNEIVEVFSGGARPSALIVQGTQILSSTLNALASLGLRIPDDISVMAIGDSDMTRGHVPPITTMALDHLETVRRIADPVLTRIKGLDQDDDTGALQAYSLIERASCIKAGSGG
ncbi:LacI family DNA-binding transcriptional regulator [Pseudooceanicola sp. C21-150M6]|uniref:LacI family DNA-binding transcriptional regulator n=1 Tax=Pseudooceanicola sp. C21-150M6 TaxID=3434355 RepID=UPI003D7FA9D3